MRRYLGACLALAIACASNADDQGSAPSNSERRMDRDEFAYLERSADDRTRNWVERESKRTLSELQGDPRFSKYLEIALASERVADEPNSAGRVGPMTYAVNHDWVYQILRDTKNPRGLLRRTSWNSYVARQPTWSTLVATAALAAPEAREWILLYAY